MFDRALSDQLFDRDRTHLCFISSTRADRARCRESIELVALIGLAKNERESPPPEHDEACDVPMSHNPRRFGRLAIAIALLTAFVAGALAQTSDRLPALGLQA